MSNTLSVEMDPGAVCAFIETSANGEPRPFGSGFFFMRNDIVVTAKHVLTNRVDPNAPFRIVQKRYDGTREDIMPIGSCILDEVDAALVRVDKTHVRVKHPLFPSHFGLNNKKGFGAIGYDKDVKGLPENTWALAFQHVHIAEVEKRERERSEEYCITFEAPWILNGYSGGPIISEGGGVVALITEMFSSVSGTDDEHTKEKARATSIYPIAESFLSPFEYQMMSDERKRLEAKVRELEQ